MKKFFVNVREVHTVIVEVDAEDKEKAISLVEQGIGNFIDDSLEYSHTLSSDTWTVDEE